MIVDAPMGARPERRIGADLTCPTTGPAINRIPSCVVVFPFGIDAALVFDSGLRDDPTATACIVLLEAFDNGLWPRAAR